MLDNHTPARCVVLLGMPKRWRVGTEQEPDGSGMLYYTGRKTVGDESVSAAFRERFFPVNFGERGGCLKYVRGRE